VKAPSTLVGKRAYLKAYDQALRQARREICSGVTALKLTSYATVKEAVTTRVLPEELVAELGKAVRPVIDRWDPATRTLTLLSAAPLYGIGTTGELAARMLQLEQQTMASNQTPPVRPLDALKLRKPEPVTQISDGPYTGLLLDCRGLHYQPALLPKFVSEDGTEFWGTLEVNRMKLLDMGLAVISTDYRSALEAQRIGDTPLIIRPIGVAGLRHGDLVFSADDVKRIQDANAQTHFLSTLSVAMVID